MRVRAHGIDIEYETFGNAGAPPMVLVMGFSQQLVGWDDSFCGQLAERGFHVVRFDNRDIGLSTKFDSSPVPRIRAILSGDTSTVAYSIEDMADDTAGLIEELGLGSAHVVGTSMGGMIAQSLAIAHPTRLRSLTSIMSTTGERTVGQPSPEALQFLSKQAPSERNAHIEYGVRMWRALGSPGFPFDEARVRDRVQRAFDRCYHPAGAARQAATIISQRDRTRQLRDVRIPAAVIHGADDPLIHVSGGEATARAIPGAKLVVVPGMGHDLPEGLWPLLIDTVVENAQRAP
jgi:pimeloyl-ACP methyl ester carboxylesterase